MRDERLRGSAPVVVCIPARDEIERLPRLLDSLSLQQGFGDDRPLRMVVVVNNSQDGTADRVRACLRGWPSLAVELVEEVYGPAEAHVGTARRRALDLGADRLTGESDGVLLTTDADARLPANWVAANLAALAGADLVGGRLVIDRETDAFPALDALHECIERYWVAVREVEDRLDPPPHDPAPRHGDHTGASLGLRASLYREVGGLPPLSHGEDNALVAKVGEAGGRIRHCPSVRVRVSDRLAGRAEGGMAVEMVRRLNAATRGEDYLLPAPSHWVALVRRRAALRDAWRAGLGEADSLLSRLGLPSGDIVAIALESCPNDIAFVERASRRLEARDPAPALVTLHRALAAFSVPTGRLAPAA